jgi:magnesium-transporting ATPase (P-type)
MLTGDKLETAIEVAKSCNLIAPDYEIVFMKHPIASIREVLEESRQRITNSLCKYTLVIEGTVLSKITNDEEIEK